MGKVGVLYATAMVAGNIMGAGIFMVPSSLAQIGNIASLGWVVSSVGAMCLGLVYAKFASIEDGAGGSYAFCKRGLGPHVAFVVNAAYFLSVIVGNVAGAFVGVTYSMYFSHVSSVGITLGAVALIWLMCFLNWLGPHRVMQVQSACTTLTILPMLYISITAWSRFSWNFFLDNWIAPSSSQSSLISVAIRALNLQLWAFSGLETAAALSSLLRTPRLHVPIATVASLLISATLYSASTISIMGLFPNISSLQKLDAPFAEAASLLHGPLAATVVSTAAALGSIGSVAGWMLVAAESARAAATDGLFPAVFLGQGSGLVAVAAAMTFVCVASSGSELIDTVLDLSSSTTPTWSEYAWSSNSSSFSSSSSSSSSSGGGGGGGGGGGSGLFAIAASISSLMTLVPYVATAISLGHVIPLLQSPLWTVVVTVALLFCALAVIGSQPLHVAIALFILVLLSLDYRFRVGSKRQKLSELNE